MARKIFLLCLLVGGVALFGARPTFAAGVVGNGTPGSCTTAALDKALKGSGRITFNCGAAVKTIRMTGNTVIEFDTTIIGGGKIELEPTASRHFRVRKNATLRLKNIVLKNATSNSGAIENSGTLILRGVGMHNNYSTKNGGAITNHAELRIRNSTFLYNAAQSYGGAIYSDGGLVNIRDSIMQHNDVIAGPSAGGALYVDKLAAATLRNVTLRDNTAQSGGAISGSGLIAIHTSTLVDNVAANMGGAIWQRGTLTLEDSTVMGNRANTGGGLYVDITAANAVVERSTFYDNTADYAGGGMHTSAAAVVINSTFASNNAQYSAGFHRERGDASLRHVTLRDNPATYGAGVSSTNATGMLYVQNTAFASTGYNCSVGNYKSLGNNLSTDNQCLFLTASGDQQSQDALLGALGNFGGPTLTFLPALTSPLLNNGADIGLTSDQRGEPRPVGAPDIGAVEVQ